MSIKLSREEALNLTRQYVKNDKLVKHMLAVEAIMKALARRLNEDEELWGLTGLLHDLDYELTQNDFTKHGLVSAELLKDKLPEVALNAIKAHNELTGFKDNSRLSIALRACDALSGLIVATALVMPNKKLHEVKLETLKRKFKQKDFARNVSRDKIMLCRELGLELDEFLSIGLEALKSIAQDLGL